MKENNIMVSVIIPTYNHEKYIIQAIESVLMQETKYSYEILVGEDCSTDDTREKLLEFERNNPGKIKIYYRKNNMNNEEIWNSLDLKKRSRGKYLITLEGDDYWIDNKKIQKQVEFLEKNNDYIAISHNCVVVDQNSNSNGELYPECKDNEYTLEHYMKGIMPGQLTTVMMRNSYIYNIFDNYFIEKKLYIGDKCVFFSLISNGKIWCEQKKMSAYRHITDNGSSFSANHKYNFDKDLEWKLAQYDYAVRINNKKSITCAKLQLVKTYILGITRAGWSITRFISEMKKADCGFFILIKLIKIEIEKRFYFKDNRIIR